MAIDRNKLREQLAALEHAQWVEWSQHVAARETLSSERLARWRSCWAPYAELPESVKDPDRVYADRVLALLGSVLGDPPLCLEAEVEADR